MDGDDWAVVLLDLLFPQGEGGNEGDVEMFFYGHGEVIVCFRGICNLLLFLVVESNGRERLNRK